MPFKPTAPVSPAMWQRLRGDFRLALITLFGLCGVAGITPFVVYRFAIGHVLVGVIDAVIVCCIGSAVIYAWRTGNTSRSGMFLVGVNTTGSVVIATMLGMPGLFWMYPAFLSNYFLVERHKAVVATVLALVVLTLHRKAFASTLEMVLFVVSSSVVSLFAFIFAQRTETQRQTLEALATHDPLTGAQNRRAMEQELQIALERHRRDGTSCGLVMLDLDNFKSINDKHGHEAGDQVLVQFADLVRKSTRQVDRFFRFGGEEFLLLLSPASTAAMDSIAAKLCRTVEANLRCGGEPVTVSVGGAVLRGDEDWRSLLARADAALYRAKNEGRNRAVIDDEPRAEPIRRTA
jgi:diguanylate cyclase (GGDEF)-like protein